ncbi:MAG: MGMT family protein [Nitrososphaeria archaeon]|jgi:O-6-methylguanine DNA methyltransferase
MKKNIDRNFIYKLLKQVPKGRVTTYKALAKASGNPKGSRAVGAIMRTNPYAPVVPCHRVVYSDSGLGGFSGLKRLDEKVKILKEEGVIVKDGKIEDFSEIFFDDFSSEKTKNETLP